MQVRVGRHLIHRMIARRAFVIDPASDVSMVTLMNESSLTAEATLPERVATQNPAHVRPDQGLLLRLVRHQPLAFAVVGVVNTVIGYLLFVLWSLVLADARLYQVAVVGAYSISVIVAFALHRTLVFRVRGHLVRDFVGFVGVNSVGLALNLLLLTVAVSALHAPPLPAQAVVMLVVAAVSYIGHRSISFRRRSTPLPASAGSGVEPR